MSSLDTDNTALIRRGLRVRGTVQGVGFRPYVHRLASEHALAGFVRNDEDGVWIEVEGERRVVARFEARILVEAPPLAHITSLEGADLSATASGALDFRIVESASTARARTMVPFDCAPCGDCLRELFDPNDRRFRYPFVNCTACGPRYTLVRDLPYDRAKTTMSAFTLCEECRREYEDPRNRRFHAEPNACPACGPSLRLESGELGDAALRAAVLAIAAGRIVAVKGVGGFLLATDACNEDSVSRLRERKHRPHKPFALMARDLAEVERIAHLNDAAREALASPTRPFVLVKAREKSGLAPSIAPRLREIGVMLPPSPLHALLAHDGPSLQVMTSGNLAEEPIAKDDDEALDQLRGIADVFLLHDRAIHTRIDDSVVRSYGGFVQPVRRARGFVPEAIELPVSGPPVLAVGADVKSAICIVRDGEAFLSQHIGDLESGLAYAFFEETAQKLARLLDVTPSFVAHDLHPEYRSTRWALASGLERIEIQHHHAHIASCLAEHGRTERAIGVAFDGTGCGPHGDLWGGEFLVADLESFTRAGHLRPVALPGGEAAIREPWRIGMAAVIDAEASRSPFARVDAERRTAIERMIRRNVASPLATGAGRWFDAIAGILGCDAIGYEGQAAIELEAMALDEPLDPYPFAIAGKPFVVDLRPMVRGVVDDVLHHVALARIAARFHETMSLIVVESCRRVRDACGLSLVALSGGCFQNARLTERSLELLSRERFEVLVHRRVPPNDGGIALGQAAIATARMRGRSDANVPRNSR